MSPPLDPGDKKILVLAACLLVLMTGAALFLSTREEGLPPGFPSSYSTDSTGAKAAYLLLAEMGYHVERWMSPPGELPERPESTLLIVAGPIIPVSADEAQQLQQFVARGGRLLVTGFAGASWITAMDMGLSTTESYGAWRTFVAESPALLTRHAPEISMKNTARMSHLAPGQQRYYGDKGGAVVAKYRLGKGEIVWWADDSPLTNYGLTQASNLELFLNSVGLPGPAEVLWDEYFHGQQAGLWHYLERTPMLWALAQLLVLAVFASVTYARRSGPVRPLRRESRLSPLEFVETLGALYERRGAAAGALEIALSNFRFLVTRRLGLPSAVPTADLVHGVRERLGWATPGLADTLQRIESAMQVQEVTEPKALEWIGQLYDFAHRLGLDQQSLGEGAPGSRVA